MNESQQRAFSALGIGPIWRTRTPPTTASPAGADSRRVFALTDEDGGWLFVGETRSAADGGDAVGARDADPIRLLERMLVALGLRSAGQADEATLAVPASDVRGEAVDAAGELARYIDARAPRVVVALGTCAAQALLRTDAPLAALRGRVHGWRTNAGTVPVVVSWHPSQLLEAPHEKAGAWADLCLARTVHDRATG